MKKLITASFLFVLCSSSFAAQVAGNDIASFLMNALVSDYSRPNTQVKKAIHGHGYYLEDTLNDGVISCWDESLGELTPAYVTKCDVNLDVKIGGDDISSFLLKALEEDYAQPYTQVKEAIHGHGFILIDRNQEGLISCYREPLGELTPAFENKCDIQL